MGRSRSPPTADGEFYHSFARDSRAASGTRGYGPTGPSLTPRTIRSDIPPFAISYAIFGASPGVAMIVNSFFGAAGAASPHRVALRELSPRVALLRRSPSRFTRRSFLHARGDDRSRRRVARHGRAAARRAGKQLKTHVHAHIAPWAWCSASRRSFAAIDRVRADLGFVSERRARSASAEITLAVPSRLSRHGRPQLRAHASLRARQRERRMEPAHRRQGTENGAWQPTRSLPRNAKRCGTRPKKTHASSARRAENPPNPWISWRACRRSLRSRSIFLAGPWYLHESNAAAF